MDYRSVGRCCFGPSDHERLRAVSGVDYEDRVRRMWAAFEREGVTGMRPYLDDDVEWTPSNGGGILRGMAELEEYWRAHGARQSVIPHAWEQHGACVLVHGSMRMFRDGGFVDTQPSWVYFFRGEKLVRGVAYSSREDALAAIEAYGSE
jgi:ketosteroid isomerase-like protein